MRYDDPANSRLLDDINNGHAPPAILNVRVGQPVELRVQRRLDEDYTPPASARTFTGSGNRLGAAVPHEGTSVAPPPPAEGTRIPISPTFELDLSVPTASIQLRLSDGSRMAVRLNHTHTIADLRNYINAYVHAVPWSPESLTRSQSSARIRWPSLHFIDYVPDPHLGRPQSDDQRRWHRELCRCASLGGVKSVPNKSPLLFLMY